MPLAQKNVSELVFYYHTRLSPIINGQNGVSKLGIKVITRFYNENPKKLCIYYDTALKKEETNLQNDDYLLRLGAENYIFKDNSV